MKPTRIAVFALDSVPPQLLFDKLMPQLPNLGRMHRRGISATLRSCDPPITVPAWMVMMTGKDPGSLGIYGFRHRRGASYSDTYIVSSENVKDQTLWERLGREGKRSIVIGVPPTYPPKKSENVRMVTCMITPNQEKVFTNPPQMKDEVLRAAGGEYLFDVTFRTDDRRTLKEQLFEMTRRRFDVAERLVQDGDWDFFMLHEIGFDRLHHAFWKFFDRSHSKHPGPNEFENIDLEYYRMVDGRIGRLLELLGEDTLTFVLSDHGSKGMTGGLCINQWLEKQGYLRFKTRPKTVLELESADVDWGSTRAWGWGGYYARIFFNVKGREPQGVVDQDDLEREKATLTKKLLSIKDPEGRPLKNTVMDPAEIYSRTKGDRPDLMVYFGDLDWRSAGTVGHESMYLTENDTGPDDSVHSTEGVFMMYDPGRDLGGKRMDPLSIQDVGPTLLKLFGYEPEPGIAGKAIAQVLEAGAS